jgi:hypothetical protein
MTFKVKNIRERNDNKLELGKKFSEANLGNNETIESVKEKIAP